MARPARERLRQFRPVRRECAARQVAEARLRIGVRNPNGQFAGCGAAFGNAIIEGTASDKGRSLTGGDREEAHGRGVWRLRALVAQRARVDAHQ